MSLFDTVNASIKQAMKARDKQRLEALKGIKAEFLLIKTAPENNGEVSDENATKAMVRMVKQRKESAALYTSQNRQDLADEELAQAAVIEEFLPKQLSDEQLTARIKEIIAQTGASSIKDMGRVMGQATKQLAGQAEGRAIAAKVKQMLQ